MSIEELTDRIEIQEALFRYCRGIDRSDLQALLSCFHPDSFHVKFGDRSHAFCEYAVANSSAFVVTHHQVGNLSIEVQGDRAESQNYFTAFHRIGQTPPSYLDPELAGWDWFVGGRYLDSWEKRGGVWKIVRRDALRDWTRYEPPADRGFFDDPANKVKYK
jgi:hypothetical protein